MFVPPVILDLTAARGNIFSGKSVRRGGRLRSVSGGILWYLGALTLQQHQIGKRAFAYKVQVEEAEWEMMQKRTFRERRAEVKVGNELSARTGSEPQRKPIGLGAAISIVPTHCKSLELSIVIGREGFGMVHLRLGFLLAATRTRLLLQISSSSRNSDHHLCNLSSEISAYAFSDVTQSDNKFRLSDAHVSIRFTDATMIYWHWQIPINNYQVCFGSSISDCFVTVLFTPLDWDVNVCVSLFDGLPFAFHSKLDSYGSEPKVVVVTSINPKFVGALLFLNLTSGNYLYFDTEQLREKKTMKNYIVIGDGSNQTLSSSKLLHAQKIEPLTISELNKYVITSEPQIIAFLCTAKVNGTQTDKGWCYIGSSKCSTKLQRDISSFTCLFCDKTNVVAALRHRVELSVSDLKDDAVFVAFDMEIHLKLRKFWHSVNARVYNDIPQFISDIVGKTCIFQLKLVKFNFTSKHQTFTIPRIISEHQHPPLPDFVIHVGT
ncbi:LOW QUALITY PROTEIN: hypothetical protein HID58_069915 [Brassica napus]|uniref:Uncharacterized protein n=1 Tax=Brassica napus TaxID=3708 RepID=A0ABQ7YXD1_BRANA|nr:LOW QUALITY PROTEIN: hypothetical protein HID58_069915 [Brassica napus]